MIFQILLENILVHMQSHEPQIKGFHLRNRDNKSQIKIRFLGKNSYSFMLLPIIPDDDALLRWSSRDEAAYIHIVLYMYVCKCNESTNN